MSVVVDQSHFSVFIHEVNAISRMRQIADSGVLARRKVTP
jgi:hypothetical protein